MQASYIQELYCSKNYHRNDITNEHSHANQNVKPKTVPLKQQKRQYNYFQKYPLIGLQNTTGWTSVIINYRAKETYHL